MNYSIFGRFQWICVDANILETMPRKTEENKIVFKVVCLLAVSIKWSTFLLSLVWQVTYFVNAGRVEDREV